MDQLLEFHRISSDITRLRILMLLLEEDLCVCEIQGILDVSQPKVSKHLAKLRDAGFVKTSREDQFIRYALSVDDPVMKAHLETIMNHIEEYPDLLDDNRRLSGKEDYMNACGMKRSSDR
jgi:ArsR family transcriptional regulator, arsenate/arsenite/antimonite-responsive transcriptional repressor